MAPFSITPDFESTACEGVPPRVGSAPSWPERRDAGDIVEALHLLHFTANDEIYADVSNNDAIFKRFSGVVRTCNFRNNGRWRIKLKLTASLMIGTSSV